MGRVERGRRVSGSFSVGLSGAMSFLAVLFLGAVAAQPAGQSPLQNPLNQSPLNQNPLNQNPRQQAPFDPASDWDPLLAARQLKAMNAERQKTMVTDTERLLRLAQEINSDIGAGDRNAFTLVEVRKIADIEKLAHDVKQKMSTSLVGGPSPRNPFPSPVQ
jgi:hypothetical protein